jgi:chromosome partitioning protein
MPVISIINQKGGVGKTTLSVHIATALSERSRVLLVDADPQGSSLDWESERQEKGRKLLFPVIGLPKKILHVELPKMAKDFDAIVIDGPPRIYDVARSAIQASDVVLLPVQPSQYDVWAAEETVTLVEECATLYKTSLQRAFVINRKIVNTAIGRDVRSALARFPIPVLKTAVCQRVAFAESAQGMTVFDLEQNGPASRQNGPATREIRSLVKEVMQLAK